MLFKSNYNYQLDILKNDFRIYQKYKDEINLNESNARLDKFLKFVHVNKNRKIRNFEATLQIFRHCRNID